MKAIRSGLGLTERSAFYVSHTCGFWRVVKPSTSVIARLWPLMSVPRPSPILARCGRTGPDVASSHLLARMDCGCL